MFRWLASSKKARKQMDKCRCKSACLRFSSVIKQPTSFHSPLIPLPENSTSYKKNANPSSLTRCPRRSMVRERLEVGFLNNLRECFLCFVSLSVVYLLRGNIQEIKDRERSGLPLAPHGMKKSINVGWTLNTFAVLHQDQACDINTFTGKEHRKASPVAFSDVEMRPAHGA